MAVERRCWVNTVSLDHVQRGVEGGFTQADHGRSTRLRRLSPGDGIAFYSPRTQLRGGQPVQAFSALAEVTGEQPYEVEVSPARPWRLAVRFLDTRPADVRPLLPRLSFVIDERRWGLPFRRGLFEVTAEDITVIAGAMGAAWPPR